MYNRKYGFFPIASGQPAQKKQKTDNSSPAPQAASTQTTPTKQEQATQSPLPLRHSSANTLNFPQEAPNSVYNFFNQGDLLFGIEETTEPVGDKLATKNMDYLFANTVAWPGLFYILKLRDFDNNTLASLPAPKHNQFLFFKKHEPIFNRSPGKPVPKLKHHTIKGSACRRACKLSLVRAKERNNAFAHVLTKGIDWQRVCGRKDLTDLGVTNSELRAAYRDYRKNGINSHIIFYDANNIEMRNPPWLDEKIKPYFDEYNVYRAAKPGKKG